ncbi:MAG: T9SS type A sorting domain-containing protein [Flavobacteriales bacterium]|nr:T9SS type A sorting domain-containing protein [Flavobacteriales bacterium]
MTISSFGSLWAQTWFEGNPKWEYDYADFCIVQTLGWDRVFYEQDTLIQGKTCALFKVKSYRKPFFDPGFSQNSEFILYDSADVVYKVVSGNFVQLYDFNLQIGDTIEINIFNITTNPVLCDDTLFVVIDTIDRIVLNNDTLRIQRWKLLNNTSVFGTSIDIIEKIGVVGRFPFDMSSQWGCGIDACYPFSFTCYANDSLDFNYPLTNSCSITPSVIGIEELDKQAIKISPNPTSGRIKLSLESAVESANIQVIDYHGRLVHAEKLRGGKFEHQIDLSNLDKGLYLVLLLQGDKRMTQQVVLH